MSLFLVPIGWLVSDPFSIVLGEIFITCCFGLVFSVASVAMAEGAKRLSAMETALIGALETPLAPVWAFLLLREVPANYTVVGGSIILLAVLCAEWFGRNSSGN